MMSTVCIATWCVKHREEPRSSQPRPLFTFGARSPRALSTVNSERIGIKSAMLPPLRPIERRAAKEVSMDEVFPILAGIALGLITLTLRGRWRRIAVIGILGVALGFVASWISGELIVSRLYVLVDAAQVIVAACLTGLLVPRWLRRRARSAAMRTEP